MFHDQQPPIRRKIDIIALSVADAANQGYSLGFTEGFEAAAMVVDVMIRDGEEKGRKYYAEGCRKALEMSRNKAREMMGTPAFVDIGTTGKPSEDKIQ